MNSNQELTLNHQEFPILKPSLNPSPAPKDANLADLDEIPQFNPFLTSSPPGQKSDETGGVYGSPRDTRIIARIPPQTRKTGNF